MTLSLIKPSRKIIRAKVKLLVDGSMVGDGLPLVACYAYEKSVLSGITPCMVINSEDTDPLAQQDDSDGFSELFIGAHAFVLYEDEETNWTEEDSENAMDDINQYFRSLMSLYLDRTKEENPEWQYLILRKTQYDSYTDLEGNEFRHEYYPMTFQVPNIA